METKIVKIDVQKPDLKAIEVAAEIIDQGGLVVFPTETVYGIACRVEKESLHKLDYIKGRTPDKRYTLHISENADLSHYLPNLGLRGRKLIMAAWPGPVTIVFELSADDIAKVAENFDNTVVETLYRNNTIGLRCPDNKIASLLLQHTKFPVVAPSANLTGQQPSFNAEQVIERLGGKIEMLLDGGPCQYKKNSTVVKLSGDGLTFLREGAYPKSQLIEDSKLKFLFVCTGNTCRSPMAEGLFKKYLAEKLGCSVDNLDQMGYKISSAGTMGLVGIAATAEAVTACRKRGADIEKSGSSALSWPLVEESDYIFAMTRSHASRVLALRAEAAEKCFLLAKDKDIADPIGQSQDVYDLCADEIEDNIKKILDELKL